MGAAAVQIATYSAEPAADCDEGDLQASQTTQLYAGVCVPVSTSAGGRAAALSISKAI